MVNRILYGNGWKKGRRIIRDHFFIGAYFNFAGFLDKLETIFARVFAAFNIWHKNFVEKSCQGLLGGTYVTYYNSNREIFSGLWAFITGLAVGVTDPDGYIFL